jgi:hypothetical protein
MPDVSRNVAKVVKHAVICPLRRAWISLNNHSTGSFWRFVIGSFEQLKIRQPVRTLTIAIDFVLGYASPPQALRCKSGYWKDMVDVEMIPQIDERVEQRQQSKTRRSPYSMSSSSSISSASNMRVFPR